MRDTTIEVINNELEKAVLVGVDTGEDEYMDSSMDELASLAEACEMECVGEMTQTLPEVNKATCLGSGKLAELRAFVKDMEADTVIFDNTLSPMQMKNLQDELGCAVMDRTGLILEIFLRRAKTKEAKLQVESARLKYMLPRLAGMRKNLGRQGGGSGAMSNKGAGEKKIELDRRVIEHRISVLRHELESYAADGEVRRKKRKNENTGQVALVGYTNAGKSTIMNSFLSLYGDAESKSVMEKDMLFATLDTSVRRISIKDKEDFFLSDTVGFIHKLPHGLVEAFKSTLAEVLQADLLLHVVDFSDENYKQHIQVTKDTLNEIGAGGIPVIYIYNKCDKVPGSYTEGDNSLYISAKNEADIEKLADKILRTLYKGRKECSFKFPYSMGAAVNEFKENCRVTDLTYENDSIMLKAVCSDREMKRYAEFLVDESLV